MGSSHHAACLSLLYTGENNIHSHDYDDYAH